VAHFRLTLRKDEADPKEAAIKVAEKERTREGIFTMSSTNVELQKRSLQYYKWLAEGPHAQLFASA